MVDDAEMAEMLQLSWSFFWPRPRLGNKVISLFKTWKMGGKQWSKSILWFFAVFLKHNTEINVSNVVAGMDLSFPIFLLPFFFIYVFSLAAADAGNRRNCFCRKWGKRKKGETPSSSSFGMVAILIVRHLGKVQTRVQGFVSMHPVIYRTCSNWIPF